MRKKERKKCKIIEIVEGYWYIGNGIKKVEIFANEAWEFPNTYLKNINPDKYRKVRIIIKEL